MYPLKFENIYFDKIWGGRDLESFRMNLPQGSIGESWDVACHPHGISVISNGTLKGKTLKDLIKESGEQVLGTELSKDWFPLLVKLINAKDKLSIQVHPDDAYGMRVEGEMGKTEVWYVVEALQGANLVVGTKEGCTKEAFEKAIITGDFDEYVNRIDVKTGDVYFVKSGLVHAIGEGVVIAEIQQNSDTTYRVFDYNRGRDLHVEKALEVTDLELRGSKSEGLKIEMDGYSKIYYCLCEHFSLELYDIKGNCKEHSDEERFHILTCVEGNGEIEYEAGVVDVLKGDSILIPATLGSYELKGEMKVLRSYKPDIKKVEKEILSFVRG